MLELKAQAMRSHDWTPLFKLEHMLKDVDLCLEAGAAAGVAFPAARRGARALVAGLQDGLGRGRLRGPAGRRTRPLPVAGSNRASTPARALVSSPIPPSQRGLEIMPYLQGYFGIWGCRGRMRSAPTPTGRSVVVARPPGTHPPSPLLVLCRLLSKNGRSPSVRSPKASSCSHSARAAFASRRSTSSSSTSGSSCTRRSTTSATTSCASRTSPSCAARSRRASGPTASRRLHALTRDGGIPQPDRVRIRAWAEVAGHWTVTDRRAVDALSPFYVWTTDYAEKRLAWKRRHPLHVVLLRTYRIPRPVTVKVRDEYGGCRSWLEITRDLPFEGTPGALRRRVRARLRGDRGDRRRRPHSRRSSDAARRAARPRGGRASAPARWPGSRPSSPSFRARHESADARRRRARRSTRSRRRARGWRSSSRERPPTSRSSSTAPPPLLDARAPARARSSGC